ncbi:jacalin-related lectin 24-like [Raphanus sativus]|uniref:Jacalin-related lectin 24-like n=1 Tax=Raphanus sativus TaxID=3726 RepID=A0A6J0N807_RAPSA|nr:jacalin-related lectin 24-like [Raphanus sativus]
MGPIGRRDYIRIIEWDEVGHNIISHIIVSYDISGVRSIQFGYVENGALVMSKTYGGSPLGLSSRIVRLKHESEFITGISMEIYSNSITSLTFHTNQRKHEAVHLTFDTKFSKPQKMELHSGILERSEFGGFFGTRGDFDLFSIGICVRLNLPGAEKIKNEKV